jgi:ERCC4-type nuclease
MEVIVDYREKKIINILNEKKFCFISDNLTIGDIIFKNVEEILLIIERKTYSDLYSSLMDNRYNEQKSRLIESNCPIMYIIEGPKNGIVLNIDSILLSFQLKNNFFIMLSENTEHTCNILLEIYKKHKAILEDVNNNNCVDKSKNINYKSFTKLKKNIENNWLIQLTTINSVSSNIGKKIIEIYPTCKDLIIEYYKLDFSITECILLLENIKNGNRRIGKKCSEKIFNALCCKISS